MMKVGAQRMFYASHACKSDTDSIFRFLQEQPERKALCPEVFRAMQRHFYFIQQFSDDCADRCDTFYYDRE